MNTLEELNNSASGEVTYTDSRSVGCTTKGVWGNVNVNFDSTLGTDGAGQHYSTEGPLHIRGSVKELFSTGATAATRLTIEVDLTNANAPTFSFTNPGGNVSTDYTTPELFIIENIETTAQANSILNSATWKDSAFIGDFTYTVTLKIDTTTIATQTVSVQGDYNTKNLSDTTSNQYYETGPAKTINSITIDETVHWYNLTYSCTITPTVITGITAFTTDVTNWDGTDIELTGLTWQEMNRELATLSMTRSTGTDDIPISFAFGIDGEAGVTTGTHTMEVFDISTLSPVDDSPSNATTFTITFTDPILIGQQNKRARLYDNSDAIIDEWVVSTDGVISTNTFSLTTTETLTTGINHYIKIDSGALIAGDHYWTGITDKTTWNWTVVNLQAATYTPANDSRTVDDLTELSIRFNNAIAANTGNLYIYDYTTLGLLETFAVGAGSIATDTITFTPSVVFNENKRYYVSTDADIVEVATEPTELWDGLTIDKDQWEFTTEELGVDFDPHYSQDINSVPTFSITFPNDISIIDTTATARLYDASDDTLKHTWNFSTDVTATTNVLTLDTTPSVLVDTNYYILVDAGAIKSNNIKWNGVSSTTEWTVAVVELAYTVAPVDNATDTGREIFGIAFTDTITVNTGNIYIKRTSDDVTIETFDVTTDITLSTTTTTNDTITFLADPELTALTEYYIITDVDVLDIGVTTWGGISDTTEWSFTPGSGGPIINMEGIDRNYTENTENFIFASTTPVITHNDIGEFTIELSTTGGEFTTDYVDNASTWTFTGSMTECNAKFANIIFLPTANTSTNTTFTYTQKSGAVTTFTTTENILGSAGASSSTVTFTSSDASYTPAGVDMYYAVSFDLLVVGGGGGGVDWTSALHTDQGGGGGGGDVLETTLSATDFTSTLNITIGSGGSNGQPGLSGVSSSVITSASSNSASGGIGGYGSSGGTSGAGYGGGSGIQQGPGESGGGTKDWAAGAGGGLVAVGGDGWYEYDPQTYFFHQYHGGDGGNATVAWDGVIYGKGGGGGAVTESGGGSVGVSGNTAGGGGRGGYYYANSITYYTGSSGRDGIVKIRFNYV